MVLGFLITIGLLTRIALTAGGPEMVALLGGTTLAQEFDTSGQQLLHCLVYFALLSLSSRDDLTFDAASKP